MRTIKFRGKNICSDEWIYGTAVKTQIGDFIIAEDTPQNPHICPQYGYMEVGEFAEVWSNTIGQFTSLYDKNGKEIYEGDILDFNGIIIEVCFVRGVFALLCNGDLDEELCGDCRTDLFAKIIGNIYDNPELLKGGKE